MQTSEGINGNVINQVFNLDKMLIQNGDLAIVRDDSIGLPSKKTLGNISELINYNQYGEISSRDVQRNNFSVYREVYTRDKLGRITNKEITKNNNFVTNKSYAYDVKGRLKSNSLNGVLKNTFNYDAQGNRLSIVSNNFTRFEADYNSKDRITQLTQNGKHTLFSYSEDDQQFLINQVEQNVQIALSVSPLNSLQKVEVTTPQGVKTVTYLIDGENKRAAKIVNGVVKSYYVYDKYQRLVAELSPDFSLKSRFIYGLQSHSPDYMINNGETLYFVKDQLGSILQAVNSAGVIRQELDYDLFGGVAIDSNPGFQPFGFAGGHYDWETGLVRFGARDYDAEVGRWLERDPMDLSGF